MGSAWCDESRESDPRASVTSHCQSSLDADQWLGARDLARQACRIGRIYNRGNILVSIRRFLCHSAHRRASNQDTPRGEVVDELPSIPGARSLVSTHRPARPVAR